MIRGLAVIFGLVVVVNLGLLASGLIWRCLCGSVRSWQRRRQWRRIGRFAAPILVPRRYLEEETRTAFYEALIAPGQDWREWQIVARREREIARAMRGGIDWPGAA